MYLPNSTKKKFPIIPSLCKPGLSVLINRLEGEATKALTWCTESYYGGFQTLLF